jgi:ligand-binding sensor domain-containing protein
MVTGRMHRFWLAFAVCLGLCPLAAQDIRFQKLSIDDGLSQNAVNTILQDRRGFMWFGTKDGLNRFDGHSFSVFRHDPFDPGTLPGNDITKLFEDVHGGLWIGLRTGALCYYRPERGTFTRIVFPNELEETPASSEITALTGSQGNTLWAARAGRGLFRLTYLPDSLPHCHIDHFFQDHKNSRSLISNQIGELVVDARGKLWIGSDQGLGFFDPQGRDFKNILALCHF